MRWFHRRVAGRLALRRLTLLGAAFAAFAVSSVALAGSNPATATATANANAEAPAASRASPWASLHDGAIVLLRHAEAPGIGDPIQFRLGDCSTQRNLNDSGRQQARRIGKAFRRQGVPVGAVWSSQWCRTHETAELAFPGQVLDDARFNSFFEAGDARVAAQTEVAQAALRGWRGPGVLVVVTHQVNITALTGVVPASGEAVILQPGGGRLKTVGRLAL